MWIFSLCLLLVACRDSLQPLRAGVEGPQARIHLSLTLPPPKTGSGLTTQALNDERNATQIGQVDLTLKASGQADWKPFTQPLSVSGLQLDTQFVAPLGRNMVLVVQGLTAGGQPIAGSRLSGTFSALVHQGSVDVDVNRLTTPVGQAIEPLIDRANDTNDAERQKARDLLLTYDGAGLQQFVNGLMGATGDRASDLNKLNNQLLTRHPALINPLALSNYLWTNGTTPTNKQFVRDANNGGVEWSYGTITGSLQGMLIGGNGTLLVDDPTSAPLAVNANTTTFSIPNVAPGNWKVILLSQGHSVEIDPFSGGGPPPSLREVQLASGQTLSGQGFKLSALPPEVAGVSPARGPKSIDAANEAFVTISGSGFGAAQAGGKVEFVGGDGVPRDANGIQSWGESHIVVAVPIVLDNQQAYTVRVSRPTNQTGVYVSSSENVTYGVGTWQKFFSTQVAGIVAPASDVHQLDVVPGPSANLVTLAGAYQTLFPPTPVTLGLVPNLPVALSGPSDAGAGNQGSVAANADGMFVRVFPQLDSGTNTTRIMGRVFAANGSAFSAPVVLGPAEAGGDLIGPQAVFVAPGQLMVAWTADAPSNGATPDRLWVARFSLNGSGQLDPVGAPVRIDQYPDGNGYAARLLVRWACKGNVCAALWNDGRSGSQRVYARTFDTAAVGLRNETLLPASELYGRDAAVAQNGDVAISSSNNLYVFGSDLVQKATTSAYTYSSCSSPPGNNFYYIPRLLFNRDDVLVTIGQYSYTCGTHQYQLILGAANHSLQASLLMPTVGLYAVSGAGSAGGTVSGMVEQPDGTVSVLVGNSQNNGTYVAQVGWK